MTHQSAALLRRIADVQRKFCVVRCRQGEVSSSTNGNSQQTPSSTSAGNVCESIGMELENIPRREGQEILENREWRRDPQPSTTPPPAAETQAGDDVAHAELQVGDDHCRYRPTYIKDKQHINIFH